MHILPIAKTFNVAKTVKKPYIAPKIEVIDMPDTPKLLARGRYMPEGAKIPYVEPSFEVYELKDSPKLIAGSHNA